MLQKINGDGKVVEHFYWVAGRNELAFGEIIKDQINL